MQLPGESEEQLKSDDIVRALVKSRVRSRCFRNRTQGGLHLPCPRRRSVAGRTRISRGRRRAPHAAFRRAGHERRHEGRGQSGVEARRRVCGERRSEDILDTYDVERAPVVRRMVEVSRRLGSVIMPTNQIAAAARDGVFACLNMSSRFRAFIARGGFLPPACHPSQRSDRKRQRRPDRPDGASADGQDRARRKPARSVPRLPPMACARVRGRSRPDCCPAATIAILDCAGCALHFSQ